MRSAPESPFLSSMGTAIATVPRHLRLHNLLDHLEPRSHDFAREISSEVLALIDKDGGGVESMMARYFRSVHKWLPILPKKMTQEQLPILESTEPPSADFSCLLLSMFLVTQPSERVSTSQGQILSSLLAKVKCIHSLVQDSAPISIKIVQAALLITVYEIGNGHLSSAYVFIGSCARMFSAMCIDMKGNGEAMDDTRPWIKLEEERRVRWGIIVLDRYVLFDSVVQIVTGLPNILSPCLDSQLLQIS